MKNIIAFIGSPNQSGRTAALVREVMKGAENSGATAKIYHLNSMDIRFCQGCNSCRKEGALCSIRDDMQEVYQDFLKADAVVIGSPVYVHQVTAQTKLLFDRLSALLDSNLKPKFSRKKAVMVYTQGNADADKFLPYFEVNTRFLKEFNLDIKDTIVYAGFDETRREELMSRAFRTGKGIVQD